jgi:hypothetical protein
VTKVRIVSMGHEHSGWGSRTILYGFYKRASTRSSVDAACFVMGSPRR